MSTSSDVVVVLNNDSVNVMAYDPPTNFLAFIEQLELHALDHEIMSSLSDVSDEPLADDDIDDDGTTPQGPIQPGAAPSLAEQVGNRVPGVPVPSATREVCF
jgi:hypothetical protein